MDKLQVIKYEHNFLLLLAEEFDSKLTWKEIATKLFYEDDQFYKMFLDTVEELGFLVDAKASYSAVYEQALKKAPQTHLYEKEEKFFLKVEEDDYEFKSKARLQTILNKVGLKLIK